MKKIILLISAILFLGTMNQYGQNTPGALSFSVTTISNGASFSPKHVLAIWIEDGSGNFVKTLNLNANKRKQYLYTWNDKSSGDVTDAVTGSTLSSHTSHEATWDGTNTSGATVADGDYQVQVEYTSEHAQGPMTTVQFTKSASGFSVTPNDATYFSEMDLQFIPESTTGIPSRLPVKSFSVYPVAAKDFLHIDLDLNTPGPITIAVYSIDMKVLKEIPMKEINRGKHVLKLDLNSMNLKAGAYFVVAKGENFYSTRKFIKE